MSNIESYSSSVVSTIGLRNTIPTVLTAMSTPPKASTAASNSFVTLAGLVRSPCTLIALTPAFCAAATALLVRAGRRITLTPAGKTLLDEGRTLLAAAQTVAQHTRAAAITEPDEFVVGHSPAVSNAEVYALLTPAIAAASGTSFTVVQLFPDRLVAGVQDGTVQLGLRRGVLPQDRLATAVAHYDRLRVA